MGINNNQLITGKSIKLNRLYKSAQVINKKMYKIRSIAQAFFF